MCNNAITGRRVRVERLDYATRKNYDTEVTALCIGGSVSNKGETTIIYECDDGSLGETAISKCSFIEPLEDWRKG